MTGKPISRISRADLDNLMTSLEIGFVRLTECLVSPGCRLALAGSDAPGIHYNLGGAGRLLVGNDPPIELMPHTLVIVPANTPFAFEGIGDLPRAAAWTTVQGTLRSASPDAMQKFVAGEGEPRLMLICGYFRALYGPSLDIFGSLTSPIVEQFDVEDQLDQRLQSVMAELIAQEVGMGAMTASLMKQVLVVLLRRSLSSLNAWAERLALLGDPQIARAFAEMAARPSAPHSVRSLSQVAALSRSAFMERFAAALGEAPMAVLRQLRMRHAAVLLSSNTLSVHQVAHSVGYGSRTSFSRAFRKVHGCDPSEFREAVLSPAKPHQEQMVAGHVPAES